MAQQDGQTYFDGEPHSGAVILEEEDFLNYTQATQLAGEEAQAIAGINKDLRFSSETMMLRNLLPYSLSGEDIHAQKVSSVKIEHSNAI